MTEIAQYPAVKQINFYILEASPELLVERREYLEVVLLKIWRSRLETIRSWNCVSDEDRILAEAYQRGIDFLTKTFRLVNPGLIL